MFCWHVFWSECGVLHGVLEWDIFGKWGIDLHELFSGDVCIYERIVIMQCVWGRDIFQCGLILMHHVWTWHMVLCLVVVVHRLRGGNVHIDIGWFNYCCLR